MSELRRLLDDPGVQHLLPPNWKDRVLAEIDRLTGRDVGRLIEASSLGTPEAKAARESVPREGGTAIAIAAKYLARAERAEADLADAQRVRDANWALVKAAEERIAGLAADLADEKRRHAALARKVLAQGGNSRELNAELRALLSDATTEEPQ